MITLQDVISIGIIRRTHYKDLPPFVFVLRDGLLVPFRSENISDLISLGYKKIREMPLKLS